MDSMKKPGFTELLLISAILAITVLMSSEVLSSDEALLVSYTTWLVAFLIGPPFILKGFDYYRIKYSFTLTFLVIIVFIYELIALLTGAMGFLQAIAVFLAPYLSVYVFGSFIDSLLARRRFKEIVRVKVPLVRRLRAIFFQLDTTIWFFMSFGFVYLLFFMLIPILLVLVQSFIPPIGGEWWSNFYNVLRTRTYVDFNPIFSDPIQEKTLPDGTCIIKLTGVNYGPLLNSLIVSAIVTTIATILGVIVAYVLARYRFPGHTLMRLMGLVPLFNTPFINAYIIKLIWSEAGPISYLFKSLTNCYLVIEGLAGVIVAQVFTFFPIVYLNAYTAFINVDPSTEEQAENLGAKGFKLFRTVTLPLALPGIAAGSILVFVFSLEDLGAPIVFNERNLISYRIYEGIITAHGIISPETAALGVILLIVALTAFLAIRNYVSMRSYAMISRGGRWNPRIKKPGIPGLIAIYLGVFPLLIFAMLPQIGVVLMSFGVLKPYAVDYKLVFETPSNPIMYIEKILSDPAISRYIINTIMYASVSLIIATFLAISVGYSVSRLKIKRIPSILDSLATAPLAIPGLVFALGYYLLFTNISTILPNYLAIRISPASPLFEAWIVFIIAFSVRRLPYIVRSVYAGFQQVHEALEESAMNLGASRYKVVLGVILPFIVGYVLSGALIGFIYMATEVSTSITFGGIRDVQAPLTYYMKMYITGAAGIGPYLVAAMGTLLITIQLIIVIVVVYVFKQRYAFIGV
ncbi:MAG: iron ABC transporter permease [Desulfurococcaceae archaeon]